MVVVVGLASSSAHGAAWVRFPIIARTARARRKFSISEWEESKMGTAKKRPRIRYSIETGTGTLLEAQISVQLQQIQILELERGWRES